MTQDSDLTEVRKLIDSLAEGPATGGGYLSWPGDLLQEAEFNLARYAERIAEKEAEWDGMYTRAEDDYKTKLTSEREVARLKFAVVKPKFTKDEVEDFAFASTVSLRQQMNNAYIKYKEYKAVVGSIQRYLLALTHRINELQIQQRYTQ